MKIYLSYGVPFGTMKAALAYHKNKYKNAEYNDAIQEYELNNPERYVAHEIDTYTGEVAYSVTVDLNNF